jgi:hypothetical protein
MDEEYLEGKQKEEQVVLSIGRLSILVFVFFSGLPVAALDFEKEINKHERTVKVRYKRPPKNMSYFLQQYSLCARYHGHLRSLCNREEAKRRYSAYRQSWDDRQRREVAMNTGEFQISLERKERRDPANVQ